MPMGVMLEPPRIRRCANHCDFCFVDGTPQGMRQALYIRDDDYRLSFRYGNFATLTNLKPWDVARIVEYRLSPLYVSVHATDPVIRRWLLRNPEAPDVLPQLRTLGEQGIRFHAQIVLVPGRSEEHTSELQSLAYLVCRLLLEKKKNNLDITSQVNTSKIQITAYIVGYRLLGSKISPPQRVRD